MTALIVFSVLVGAFLTHQNIQQKQYRYAIPSWILLSIAGLLIMTHKLVMMNIFFPVYRVFNWLMLINLLIFLIQLIFIAAVFLSSMNTAKLVENLFHYRGSTIPPENGAIKKHILKGRYKSYLMCIAIVSGQISLAIISFKVVGSLIPQYISGVKECCPKDLEGIVLFAQAWTSMIIVPGLCMLAGINLYLVRAEEIRIASNTIHENTMRAKSIRGPYTTDQNPLDYHLTWIKEVFPIWGLLKD